MKTKVNQNGNKCFIGIAMAIIIFFAGLLPAYSQHHKIEMSYYDIAQEYSGAKAQTIEYHSINGGG